MLLALLTGCASSAEQETEAFATCECEIARAECKIGRVIAVDSEVTEKPKKPKVPEKLKIR